MCLRFSAKRGYCFVALLTHPEYQRHGVGTLLANRGLKGANASWSVMFLLASLMGKPLYTQLGLKDRGSAVVHVEGEEGTLCVDAMAQNPGNSKPPYSIESCAQYRSLKE